VVKMATQIEKRDFSGYPQNVGIIAMDIVFPRQYVSQADLEQYDGVSQGKYTIGLGQTNMAYCADFEDIYSLALSAVRRFMKKYAIDYKDIGRLEVATETIVDHSKAIKTVLMQLFEESGNFDVEGIDCMNACYGGTNALFNSVAWVESTAWDGRYAMVVCGDIAEYAKGPARPTGGAGVVVMLVGPNAPLVIDRGIRASHMTHVYDFYKPNLASPFPVVDGALSQTCYLQSLDACYRGYTRKFEKVVGRPFVFADDSIAPQAGAEEKTAESPKSDIDFFVFHAPYNKLVQKAIARLFYTDYVLRKEGNTSIAVTPAGARCDAVFEPFAGVALQSSYTDRSLEQAAVALSKPAYKKLVAASTLLPTNLGNLYTASLYAGLLSLLFTQRGAGLRGKHLLCFSYGSGLAASLFSITVPDSDEAQSAIDRIADIVDLSTRLNARVLRTPDVFNAALDAHEHAHGVSGAIKPKDVPSQENAWDDTFYLVERDEKGRKSYAIFNASE